MPSYEFPFNERIRTLLRVEDLFKKVLLNVEAALTQHHHSALVYLFQTMDIIDRIDIRVDLLQELDKQKLAMQNLRGNPVIAEKMLESIIDEIDSAAQALRQDSNRLGQHIRDNEWITSIRQRSLIPGGLCEFDIPSYHHWLNHDDARRKADFEGWLAPLMPMHKAIQTILHILRGSGASTQRQAQHGFFQQMLGGAKPAQMLRVEIDDNCPCFPEVSANKYAINVRFYGMDYVQKPKQCEHDVDFVMTLCNL
ncbi:MAG TPA: cell division protein ZapD [Methylophilus sp.]|nr:cell division protein ZapD [Methylophilus sp.]HQQ33621.1 cell division protein ZapD [Methylophilus sp.]